MALYPAQFPPHTHTSSCSWAISASFSSSISPGLRDARFLGGSKLSSWVKGWRLDISWVSGDKVVYSPKELVSEVLDFLRKERRV